jgi:hypothetical protein
VVHSTTGTLSLGVLRGVEEREVTVSLAS